MPSHLPIETLRAPLKDAMGKGNRAVIQAPTGSGKSTQIPQMLVDEGLCAGRVVVLQPRRIAARMLAKRVAHERGTPLGEGVGYHIRFDRVFNKDTRILFVTEGLLLRQMLSGDALKGVGAVVFDEFHERNLYSDLSLALARQLQAAARPDLKLIVMSATLDAEGVAQWLAPCAVLTSEGRTFPVDIGYASGPREEAVWDTAARVFDKHFEQTERDTLIFMPGAYEIQRTMEAVAATRAGKACAVFPLYGELTPDRQDAAVSPDPKGRRKVVVATNVAETSLTIDGIDLVVDGGLARIARYDPRRGINTLLVEKISRASADQRAGRAGRTRAGRVVRLWGEREQEGRPARETPEVRRVDLSETLLTLLAGGIENVDTFPWFETPDPAAMARAKELLHDLGATDAKGRVTALGRRMAAFPVHPRYARMFLAADEFGCVGAACLLAALVQGRNFLLPLSDARKAERREDFWGGKADSDFFPLMALWSQAQANRYDMDWCREWGVHAQAARAAGALAGQLQNLARAQGLDCRETRELDTDALRKCILIAFSDHLALREDEGTLRCRLLHGRRGELRRTSEVRHARLLVAAEIEEVQARGDVAVLLGLATQVEEAWLESFFPDDFSVRESAAYDAVQKRAVCRREKCFRDLVLESKESVGNVPKSEAAALLAAEVRAGRIELKEWDSGVEHWIARVNFAARRLPELNISPIDEAGRELIYSEICLGKTTARDVREASVWPALKAWLSAEQRMAMDALLPTELILPHKKRPASLRYEAEKVYVSATVQELYDAPLSLFSLNGGKIPLTVEVLAPNRRPVQVTEDISAFWHNSYAQVKKDLKGRYPRHEWR